ncbi:MAG: MBL fold metallo-hydrolase [Spirochaetes bacterium]|nr:MBL fold metallo-hydrolase [Spirochaetota bacterium]
MELTFYGARGSYPYMRPDNFGYGGNSTCLHLYTSSGTEFIFDGGSGIRPLGASMMGREFGRGEGEAVVLIGHTHWDHILGFPYFQPFSEAGNRFTFLSAGTLGTRFEDIFTALYHDLNFPIPVERLKASLEFRDVPERTELEWKDARLRTLKLNHPGTTLGWRIEADGAAVAVCTDCARPRKAVVTDGLGPVADYERDLAALCEGVDALIYDTHFFEHEIVGKEDWGHSTFEDAVRMGRECGVREVILFHHAPEHSDAQVDIKLAMARDVARHDAFTVSAAREGMRISMGKVHA